MFVVLIFTVTVVFITVYVAYTFKKRGSNCGSMSVDPAPLSSIGIRDKTFLHPLRDFQVKSSYNSCASGNFKNDWVDMCALQNAIRQGCRFLDFEVYSIDGETGISVSATSTFTEKNALNWLPLDDVIKGVADLAFSTLSCPNFNDPLFLNFRVKSTNVQVFDDIAKSLDTYLNSRLLPNRFNYEANGTNITARPLVEFIGKAMIIVDKSNVLVESSKLDEFMNLGANSVFCRLLVYNDVIFTPDMNELIEFNKQNVSICLPNLDTTAANYDSSTVYPFGVQFGAMCMQTDDANLVAYNDLFAANGHAFILKPANLRYFPVTVKEAPPLDKSLSYGYTEHKGKYYNFNL